jgi:RNA polymerase sigma-70 factor, ECF subfamily
MDEHEWLGERFEEHRPYLQAVAHRMLGSAAEAEDAVQETWLRLSRSERGDVENMTAWLTTVVARVCLNLLKSRQRRRQDFFGVEPPPAVTAERARPGPEHEAVTADSVGLALLVVLDTLAPPERLAYVLHDMFALPFDEIGPMIDRSPVAARQLASRARRRVQGAPQPETDLARQRAVGDAFLAAARSGDFEALVAVLDPEVVLRVDQGHGRWLERRGAEAVARAAHGFSRHGLVAVPVLIGGSAGFVAFEHGRVAYVTRFSVRNDKITSFEGLADPERLCQVDLTALEPAVSPVNPA